MTIAETTPLLSLEKVLTKVTTQARSNPDFEKLADCLLLKALAEHKKDLGIEGISSYFLEKNNKLDYKNHGWYSSNMLQSIVTKDGLTSQEIVDVIEPTIQQLQTIYPLFKKIKADEEGMLHLWEAPQYLLFHLTLSRRKIKI